MSDLDILDQALDIIDKREEEGLPEDYEGIVTEVEVTTREQIFGSGGKYGKPDDPYVQIYFDIVYGGASIDQGRVAYPISTGIRSKLTKFNRKYGRPEKGREIVVFLPPDSDYWDIDLAESHDE